MSESKAYFQNVAGDWDQMRSGYFTEQMRDDAITRAHLDPKAVVADIGTGTGFVIQGLAPFVARVHGFDESAAMLDVARRNLADFANVELHECKGERLPAGDGSFDAVFANMYLHHTMEPFAAIGEMVRVLRPGGVLVITDLDTHDQAWMREAMADRWLGFPRDQVRDWYVRAGLIDGVLDCAQGSCCTSTPGGQKLALSVFVAIGRKA